MIDVRVYGPSGAGSYVTLPARRAVTWLDELNAWGSGSFQVHALDGTLAANPTVLDHGNIVKFVYEGTERFAFRIERRDTQVVSSEEDAGRWITVAGRGVAALLADAVVYPEYGLTRTSGDERWFNYASIAGEWYVSADWLAPVGVRYDSDPTYRFGSPADWPDNAAEWIWPTDPQVTSPAGVSYFRKELTLTAATAVRVFATGDNTVEVFVDGEPVIASDPTDRYAFRNTYTYNTTLAAGTHVIAARVENYASAADNPAGFLCTIATVQAAGAIEQVIARSDTSWLCHDGDPTPGWRSAHILRKLVSEAQARNVTALDYLTVGFGATTDSAGVAWSDRQDIAVRVGFETVLDVATKLAESAIDLAVTPDMVLNGWVRRGTDKSATVTLAKGVSLVDHRVTSTAPTATRLLARAGDGWVEAASAADATLRREAGLQLGGALSADTAEMIAASVFAETSTAQIVVESGQMPARTGATPYVDFGVGDDVSTLGEDGPVTVRVSALAVVEDSDGNVFFTPEMYETTVEAAPSGGYGSYAEGY